MNYGPIIFLLAFLAAATSWFGLVLTPHVQLGKMQPTNSVPDKAEYPVSRAGLAREGLEVYRANGCAYCHSQQAQQTGLVSDIVVTGAGTNLEAAVEALKQIGAASTSAEAKELLTGLPKKVRHGLTRLEADGDLKALSAAGVKADMLILPTGPDIARAWGARRSVAADFLYDSTVMPGEQRIGPDLANVGARLTDPNWHLRHLYAPQSEVQGSMMPPYRYLFEKRRVTTTPSPNALALAGKAAPEAGYEVVPKREAYALVSYLLSLRNDTALFQAPMRVSVAAPPAATNGAPGSVTNGPGANTTPK